MSDTLIRMPATTTQEALRPCPVELLVRNDIGGGFDAYVRSHDVTRLVPGIYVRSDAWRALPPWDRYLVKVYAVHRRRPDAVFAFESAAALLGLPLLGANGPVHILADTRGHARRTGIVQGHFLTDRVEPVTSSGVRHTSLLDTSVDIARTRHPAYALAALDDAIRTHGLSLHLIADANDERESGRGRAAAEWAIARATGIPESVLESLSLAAIEWLGFELPELQVEFALPGFGISRVDAYWRKANVIGEADGETKYRMPPGGVGDAVLREKAREDALRRVADGFARWGWAACRQPTDLERILCAAGVPRIHPPDNTRLRTLRALLTS